MSLPLHTWCKVASVAPRPGLYKVLELSEALQQDIQLDRAIVDLRAAEFEIDPDALRDIGVAAAIVNTPSAHWTLPNLTVSTAAVVSPGDVIRFQPNGQINVLYRRGANSNALFITERCNSRCLMCSQPPRDDDDSWRMQELFDLVGLIDPSIEVLGVTGGEPTLLGAELSHLFTEIRNRLSATTLHVLTNGRSFADLDLTRLFDGAKRQVVWAIPLYADTASRHDFVVQAQGAFDQTLHGIYNLAERGHRIEIRCVIHRQNVDRLTALSEFVYRNLPFVEHVAFMGLEPMGYAKTNRELLWIDPAEFRQTLKTAVQHLDDRGIAASIYNLPLCVLDPSVWRFARRSISDWKNVYADECAGCAAREQCCGFFQSAGRAWRSSSIRRLGAGEVPA